MNPEERNIENHDGNNPEGAEGGAEAAEDDFGDFEGFEAAAMESVQAQATASPWATFPDLLPVQTSPASAAEDTSQPQTGRPSEVPSVLRLLAESHQNDLALGPAASFSASPRILNPPDVSLGAACSAPSGRGISNGLPGPAVQGNASVPDARNEAEQVALIQGQLQDATQRRTLLESQVRQLQQQNQQLELQAAHNQAEASMLRQRLQEMQETYEARLAESRSREDMPLAEVVHQLNEMVASLSSVLTAERDSWHSMHRHLEDIKETVEMKCDDLRTEVERRMTNAEETLMRGFAEETNRLRGIVDQTAAQCRQEISSEISHAMENLPASAARQNHPAPDGIFEQLKAELQRHAEEQRKVFERERRHQMASLSNALTSAVQHICSAADQGVGSQDNGIPNSDESGQLNL